MDPQTIAGVVKAQVGNPRPSTTNPSVSMPAGLLTGTDLDDVASYIGEVAGNPRFKGPQLPNLPGALVFSQNNCAGLSHVAGGRCVGNHRPEPPTPVIVHGYGQLQPEDAGRDQAGDHRPQQDDCKGLSPERDAADLRPEHEAKLILKQPGEPFPAVLRQGRQHQALPAGHEREEVKAPSRQEAAGAASRASASRSTTTCVTGSGTSRRARATTPALEPTATCRADGSRSRPRRPGSRAARPRATSWARGGRRHAPRASRPAADIAASDASSRSRSLVERAVDVGGPVLKRRARERRNDHVDLAVPALAPVPRPRRGGPARRRSRWPGPAPGRRGRRDARLPPGAGSCPSAAPQDPDADLDLQREERPRRSPLVSNVRAITAPSADGDDHDGAKDVSLGSKRIVHLSPPFSGRPDYRARGRRRRAPSRSGIDRPCCPEYGGRGD